MSFLCSLEFLLFHRIEYPKRCLWKKNVPSCDLDHRPMKVNFLQWNEYNPISILYTFQIDNISSNSREIKYQNIGRTHRHTHRQTHRQTGWKQYLATPSGGEVINWRAVFTRFTLYVIFGNIKVFKMRIFSCPNSSEMAISSYSISSISGYIFLFYIFYIWLYLLILYLLYLAISSYSISSISGYIFLFYIFYIWLYLLILYLLYLAISSYSISSISGYIFLFYIFYVWLYLLILYLLYLAISSYSISSISGYIFLFNLTNECNLWLSYYNSSHEPDYTQLSETWDTFQSVIFGSVQEIQPFVSEIYIF